MNDVFWVIRRPIITEKSSIQKNAVQQLFNVKVVEVKTMNFAGKKKRVGRNMGRKPDWKKAVVTLKAGENIEFFEGV